MRTGATAKQQFIEPLGSTITGSSLIATLQIEEMNFAKKAQG
jgi:hypothetical protein